MSRKQQRRYSVIEAATTILDWNTDEEENSDDDVEIKNRVDDEQSNFSSEFSSDEETLPTPTRPAGDIPQSFASLPTVSGRDRTLWKSVPPHHSVPAGRTAAHNVFTARPGVPSAVQTSISSSYEAWKHFIDETMLIAIVKHTLNEAERAGDNDFHFSVKELETFLGLQYARGLYGKNHVISYGTPNLEFQLFETLCRETVSKQS